MTDKNKTVNYTDALTKTIVEAYSANPTRETVELLKESTGKSIRSLIAKLSKEGVYKKIERVTKAGAPIVTKMELVKKINAHFNIEINSLVKSTKADLQTLVTSFS